MLYIYIWEVQEHVSQVCSVRNKCLAGWIEEEQSVRQRTWLVCGKWFVTALEEIGEEGRKDRDRQSWLHRGLESSYQHDVAQRPERLSFPRYPLLRDHSLKLRQTLQPGYTQTTGVGGRRVGMTSDIASQLPQALLSPLGSELGPISLLALRAHQSCRTS